MIDVPQELPTDRVSLKRKLTLLTQRGFWPQVEKIATEYGWHSDELRTFADEHLPRCICPVCGAEFCLASKRLKYCSTGCRKGAAAERDRKRHRAKADAEGLPMYRQEALVTKQECCVRLERHLSEHNDHRFYTLMVVQTLFGKTALIRRWGRVDSEHTQTATTEYDGFQEAIIEMDRVVATCVKRGYNLLPPDAAGRLVRVLRPGRTGESPTSGSVSLPRSPAPTYDDGVAVKATVGAQPHL